MIALASAAILCAALGGTWLAATWLGHPGPSSASRSVHDQSCSSQRLRASSRVTYFYQRGTALHMEAAAAREKSRADTIERQVA